MSVSDDKEYIKDILEECARISTWTQDYDLTRFVKDSLVQSAVCYRITIIGEASARISDQFQKNHPELPWREMKAMRNFLIHDYAEVLAVHVWETVTNDIPYVALQLSKLI